MNSGTLVRGALVASVALAIMGCDRKETVPAGATLIVELVEPISSAGLGGSEVHARTVEPLFGDRSQKVIIPVGTRVAGEVTRVEPSDNGRMMLMFNEIEVAGGETREIVGQPITIEAVTEDRSGVTMPGAAGGSVDSRRTEVSNGVLTVVATDGGVIELPRGQRLAVLIVEPAVVPAAS